MKKIISMWMIIIFLTSFTSVAAEIKEGYYIRDLKETDNNYKSWIIEFNKDLDKEFVTKEHIYITNSENERIETDIEILKEKFKVKIKPFSKYELGKEYRLYIENNLKVLGKEIYLNQSQVMPFKYNLSVERDYIKNININYHPMISNVLVKGNSEVFEVIINGERAHYEGELTYSLGLLGYNKGDKLEIKAYDDKDNLLETINY